MPQTVKKLETEKSSRSPNKRRGNLVVITGPSGVGKGTVVQHLLETVPNLKKSVSVTTRQARAGEAEGVDYFYRSPEQFHDMVEDGKFMEWADFAGHFYGTPKQWVMQKLKEGLDVILEIEVEGAKQIKESFPQAVMVFLSPPSFEALKLRLRTRASETPVTMALRLTKARQEMRAKGLFQYEVVNDNIQEAVQNLAHIVYAERCRIRDQ